MEWDFSLWLGRLNGTIDWYQSNTTDLLLERSLPRTSGYSSILFNVGETQNTGIEVSLSSVNFDSQEPGGFRWTTQVNWFKNVEKIVL
ncbi:MAG: TonB-dependent receptor [Bacteroidia bacterium]